MNTELDLQYLTLAVKIIDLAVERGTFKGNEISTVGACRDEFARLVTEYSQQQTKEDETIESKNNG